MKTGRIRPGHGCQLLFTYQTAHTAKQVVRAANVVKLQPTYKYHVHYAENFGERRIIRREYLDLNCVKVHSSPNVLLEL